MIDIDSIKKYVNDIEKLVVKTIEDEIKHNRKFQTILVKFEKKGKNQNQVLDKIEVVKKSNHDILLKSKPATIELLIASKRGRGNSDKGSIEPASWDYDLAEAVEKKLKEFHGD